MFCPNCGNQVAEGQAFCANCGTKMQAPAAPEQPVQQPVQQPTYTEPVYTQPAYQQAPEQLGPQQSMKWYKFLIYFSLFASAILNVVSGIMLLIGESYKNEDGDNITEALYKLMDGLESVDMIFGIIIIAFAVFLIYVRFRLAGFYKNGPKMLLTVYVLIAVINIVYIIAVESCHTELTSKLIEIDYTNAITQIIVAVVMVIVNTVYFNKRKELFVK